VLEDGRTLFDLRTAKHTLSTDHGRCTLHLWSDERNLVRTIAGATPKPGRLRLATSRFGQTQTKLLELVAEPGRKLPGTRDTTRTRYVPLLERVLARTFPELTPNAFRTAMDLERSFGPAYARGSLLRGNQAWAVIGVNAHESSAIVDGILTLGILWLQHCRDHAAGRRLYRGLKVIVPKGAAALTLSRMAWLNPQQATWELYELDEASEALTERDLTDSGNLRTRLVHHPDHSTAKERFASAIAQVMELVPPADHERVDLHLRSTAELAFLLHGLEFARARISLAAQSFAHTLEVTVGSGPEETPLTPESRVRLSAFVHDLFARRRAVPRNGTASHRTTSLSRRIGPPQLAPAHSRVQATAGLASRRDRSLHPAQDPLYRAAPERWLESVLRRDLAPLTRGLAASPQLAPAVSRAKDANDDDNFGNRASDFDQHTASAAHQPRVIPRFDPRFVYAQVPAIAGASDRGMLDLLGLTADGRLAVIELKAAEDLHFALQGLDYWIRVRHHHRTAPDAATGLGEFQRHGYFAGAELSPLPPRLYLVAPALHIHPATETVLRSFSPEIDWQLLALDDHWREQVRVVWRKGPR
jgi:hypothetical protein